MTSNSIFPKLSISRSDIHWEDHLKTLTPTEFINGMWFKREDYFAPLGYGGINGSKLRQAIWLMERYYHNNPNGRLISGTSVKSPQLPMGSAVAMHYGLRSMHVVGGTKAETAIKRDMVKMATWFGAEFDIINIGYNANLQNRVKQINEEYKNDFYLHYGITLPHDKFSAKDVTEFHLTGASQVQGLPEVDNLILPAGSCNSATSVLLGLMINRPKIKNIYLIGIGPSKLKYMWELKF